MLASVDMVHFLIHCVLKRKKVFPWQDNMNFPARLLALLVFWWSQGFLVLGFFQDPRRVGHNENALFFICYFAFQQFCGSVTLNEPDPL